MLGKQMTRVGSFSMIHAAILAAALGVAIWLNPELEKAGKFETPHTTQIVVGEAPQAVLILRATMIRLFDCDPAFKGIDA